jgi:RimJ/RimL family protein N-acetyltransferase
VRLEPLSEAHLDGLVMAAAVSRETYGLSFVPDTVDAVLAFIRRLRSEEAGGSVIAFATTDSRSGRVVGSTSFLNIERWRWPAGSAMQRPTTQPDAVEIGATWLAHDVQRTAINTEAKLLMLSHAFEVWDVHRVTLKTDVRNARSRAAIERLGAKLDGILRAHQPSSTGGVRDTAYYSIVGDEWPALKERLEARLRVR